LGLASARPLFFSGSPQVGIACRGLAHFGRWGVDRSQTIRRVSPWFKFGAPDERRRVGLLQIGVRSFSRHGGMAVIDPKPSATALQSGHRNRLNPPFKLRQRGDSTSSDWMPASEGKDRTRTRPAAVGGHRRRARSPRQSAASPRPGLRVRPAPQLVATTVGARPCAPRGRLVPAAARMPARPRPGSAARAELR